MYLFLSYTIVFDWAILYCCFFKFWFYVLFYFLFCRFICISILFVEFCNVFASCYLLLHFALLCILWRNIVHISTKPVCGSYSLSLLLCALFYIRHSIDFTSAFSTPSTLVPRFPFLHFQTPTMYSLLIIGQYLFSIRKQ